ncbi:MAG: TRAFs-binding domain-containing protein [Anaerolineales bacterium]
MDAGTRKIIENFKRSCEYLRGYDFVSKELSRQPDDKNLQYYAVLFLARSGAYKQAQKMYDKYKLTNAADEDFMALGARLLKDKALNEPARNRSQSLLNAAKAYESIYEKTHSDYPGINAATLYWLSGKKQAAKILARDCMKIASDRGPKEGMGEYYRFATIAEALIIIGQFDEARNTLEKAIAHAKNDWSEISGTHKQLSLILPREHVIDVLQPLARPGVIHFSGHMMSSNDSTGRFHPKSEEVITDAICRELDHLNVGYGYGSLASGADIMISEALLARNASLQVVLPFDIDEFVDISVAPAGEEWVTRFENCIEKANHVMYATEDHYLGDDSLFHYTSRLAMGMAVQKSYNLATSVYQFAVWDGEPPTGPAGVAADIVYWKSRSLPSVLINSVSGDRVAPPHENTHIEFASKPGQRTPKAMLFADVKGFSKLSDTELLVFIEHVLGAMGEVLAGYEDEVIISNTWGDGLFVVMKDVMSAAACALELQQIMEALDHHGIGLPEHISLRIGGHYGPVYEIFDPILKKTNYFGSHVSRAARIEPVTPPGDVYVTLQFAAELAIEKGSEYSAEYVGVMPAAKNSGNMAMYVLRKNH